MSRKSFPLTLLILFSSLVVTTAQAQTVRATADPRAALERGNLSFAGEHYEAAIREYGSVPSSAGETYAQALYNIGTSYYELWRTTEAIDYYRRAIAERHGSYPRASYALGVALEGEKKLAQAKEAYQQAISQSRGEYAPAHYRLGLLNAGHGEYRTAAECFRKALKYPGLHVTASHNNLGVMFARLGRLKDAQREFEIALRQADGNFDDAAHNLQLCHFLLTATGPKQVAAFRVAEVITRN